MYKKRILFVALAIILLSQFSVAQNNTNSPYTRFGYGALSNNSSGEQRAMSGVALGHRSENSINPVNPASYSVVDSLSFMFDIGASALMSRFSTQNESKNTFNGNLEYINIQLPLSKYIAASAGLMPYSYVGYDFSNEVVQTTPGNEKDTTKITSLYQGWGGVSQIYLGLSFDFFDHIALGVNGYYMFGDIHHERKTTSPGNQYSSNTTSLTISDLRLRYGLQLFNTFEDKHQFTLGMIFEPNKKLNTKFREIGTEYGNNDTINTSNRFDLPMTIGAGLYYQYDNRLSIGLDYDLQQWKEAHFFGKTDTLSNRSKLSLGVEYIPDPKGRKALQRIRYRAGLSLGDSYYDVKGLSMPKDLGISIGFGFPLIQSKTMINTSFEYGKVGNKSQMREDFFKITVSASINELWFFKRKL